MKKLNNLVNVVHFQEMKQFSDKTIAAFGTRLNGHANVCDFYTECPNTACDNSVSFREKMIQFREWVPSNVQPHGKVQLTLEVDNSAAKQLGIEPLHHCKPTMTSALADTGAQMCVADWQVGPRL